MRKTIILMLLLGSFLGAVKAQTLKPAVLVIGNGNTAFAAALQSANSGVKTTILLQAGGFDITSINTDINSGIQEDFLKKYADFIQLKPGSTPTEVNKQKANNLLSNWTDTVENLTVIRNVMWVKADRSGNGWGFKLSDGSTIRTKVLINAGDQKINEALKITPAKNDMAPLDYKATLYRTSAAAGKSIVGYNGTILSLYQMFVPGQENFVWLSDSQDMLAGQAAGATAAYAAFFDTKTSLANLKKIQGELLHFKLNLMPYADVVTTDSAWKAIQMVGITGVLKGIADGKTLRFAPDQPVTTEEIKQPIKDFFYKAQIWFDDYKNPKMTIGGALEMMAYVGNKSLEQMKLEIEKNWTKGYQLKTKFDLNRQINRRELALLLQDYMPPFNVNVDQKGKVVR